MPENKTELRFDPEKHTYTDAKTGKRLPSVTQVVGGVCGTPQFATEWDMQRGSAVHKAIALLLRGTLDEKSLDDRIKGKIEAAKKAIQELSLSDYTFLETRMSHPLYKFAGTPDLVVDGLLVDFKSSHFPTVQPQFGGYVLLLEAQKHKIKTCREIILNDEGKYTLTDYNPARCRGFFLACLTVYQFKKASGLDKTARDII